VSYLSNLPSCGDNFRRQWNEVTKNLAAAYTTPKIGDLVKITTGSSNEVSLCGDDDPPYGILDHVYSTNQQVTVAEFVSGATIELPYDPGDTAPALGDAITVSVAAGGHDTVLDRSFIAKQDASEGVGVVIAKDAGTPHGTGFVVVRFP